MSDSTVVMLDPTHPLWSDGTVTEPKVTESVNPDTTSIDEVSTIEQILMMNDQDARVAAAVAAQADQIAAAIDGVAARMAGGGRLIYVGAGTAGRLGVLDASEVPPTFGIDPSRVVGVIAGGERAIQHAVENAEDDDVQGAADLTALDISAADAVVGIAASGHTPYVVGALAKAREMGAFTAGISCQPGAPVASTAEVGVEVVVGPEVLSGSTRLKAGTAQKMVLNMITTITMIKLGKTYGNLMVDVQATNEKLRRRSERLVSIATGVGTEEARTALAACDGSVKIAIAMVVTGSDAAQARALLAEHNGFLKAAIAATAGTRA